VAEFFAPHRDHLRPNALIVGAHMPRIRHFTHRFTQNIDDGDFELAHGIAAEGEEKRLRGLTGVQGASPKIIKSRESKS